jgi:HTH-type transcriptional regulator/antitoxin HigA
MAIINQYQPESVTHPGETLKEKLYELGIGAKEFAVKTDKPEKTITQILKGESSITPDMAIQFESVLKIPAKFWLRYQAAFDEYKARIKAQEKLIEAESWSKAMPYTKMVSFGWLPKVNTIEAKVDELLKFFGIATHHAWEKYYYEEILKAQFRISLKHISMPHAISAWLRRGEIQAQEIQAAEFDGKKFKENLNAIKKLMATKEDNFFQDLQQLCLEAGVKIVHTPCLPNAPISGATRWLKDTPLIQLSGRYKRNDIFWFTFFHEVGHILLHGKKYISLENIEYKNAKKEKEADDFAVKWTFSEIEEAQFLALDSFKHDIIRDFAKKIGTHPALIVGRMKRKKILKPSFGKEFFTPVNFE